jgi:rhodanese-related sulfurtransferase
MIIVVCHHGVRSRMVSKYLDANGFTNIINLSGGVDAWSNEVDPSMTKYV